MINIITSNFFCIFLFDLLFLSFLIAPLFGVKAADGAKQPDDSLQDEEDATKYNSYNGVGDDEKITEDNHD